MEILFIMVLGAILSGMMASSKGRNVQIWVLLGACFPLISLLVLVIIKDLKAEAEAAQRMIDSENLRRMSVASQTTGPSTPASDMKTCPHCAEPIKLAAKICRFCNRDQPA